MIAIRPPKIKRNRLVILILFALCTFSSFVFIAYHPSVRTKVLSSYLIGSKGKSSTDTSTSKTVPEAAEQSAEYPAGAIPPPPQWKDTPESIIAITDSIITEENELFAKLCSIDEPTLESTFKPFAKFTNEHTGIINKLSFYQHVSDSKAIRDASSEASEKLEAHAIEINMREDIYKMFVKLSALVALEEVEADDETKKYIKDVKDGYERNGLSTSEQTRQEIKILQQQLSSLAIQFGKNLAEVDDSMVFTEDELKGVPVELLEKYERQDTDYIVPLRRSEFAPIMKYAVLSNTRQRVYEADQDKCPENRQILIEAIQARSELSALLGFDNFGNYILAERMANNVGNVMEFIADLEKKLIPLGEVEMRALVALAEAETESGTGNGSIHPWDIDYYTNSILQSQYQLDSEKISEFFPMPQTLEKILSIFGSLFGIRFDKTQNDDDALYSTWHEDVLQYSVWTNTEPEEAQFIGWIYFDLYPRQGKFSHAASFNLVPGMTYDNGSTTVSAPVGAIVCNFANTNSRPFLKHEEVTTLFHEMGHAMHDILGGYYQHTKFAKFSGTNNVAWDFVECPSNLMEYWSWNDMVLKEISSHYETGESLPIEMIESLVRAQKLNQGLSTLRQLFFAKFDMMIHSRGLGAGAGAGAGAGLGSMPNLNELWNTLRNNMTMIESPIKTDGYASFGHLMGGYEAGYYGYLWSKVFAADIFYTKFASNPLNSEEGVAFRDAILAAGAASQVDPANMMKLLEVYLQRAANSDNFVINELGV